MLWLIQGVWAYRAEIALAARVIAGLRTTAQEVAREYIRQKIATKSKESILVVGGQILLLLGALVWNRSFPSLGARLVASCLLWAMTVYNLSQLLFVTIPELRALYRTLRGKAGYALKYFLKVSLVTELMRLNVLFLAFCLMTGISSRSYLGAHFSYSRPWVQWWAAHVRTRHRPVRPYGGGAGPARTAPRRGHALLDLRRGLGLALVDDERSRLPRCHRPGRAGAPARAEPA
jgi:hypothetical protein